MVWKEVELLAPRRASGAFSGAVACSRCAGQFRRRLLNAGGLSQRDNRYHCKKSVNPAPTARAWFSDLHLGFLRHLPCLLMTLKLSTLSIVLGLAMGLPQIYGLVNPQKFAASVRRFPRNVPAGIALMLLGTIWFLLNLNQESISEFERYKAILFIGFAAVGIGSCVFVQDLIAVRGLAVVFLLLGKLMVDTGRPMLGVTHWVLVIQTWAYVLVVAGIWFTISPFRLRDLLNWATANEKRVRVGSAIRLAFGLFVAALGLTVF
jgi:hypothetical protein